MVNIKDLYKSNKVTLNKEHLVPLENSNDELMKNRLEEIELETYKALKDGFKYIHIQDVKVEYSFNTHSYMTYSGIVASNDPIVFDDAYIINLDIIREKIKEIDYMNMSFREFVKALSIYKERQWLYE